MPAFLKRPALLLLACCLAASVHAQRQTITFGHIRLPGGAYGNYITSIVQDQQGFMWFGTWGGLYKYDGYQVTPFTHRPDDSTSLSVTWVESLYVDRAGILWVGTFGGGLNRFDRETETFTPYRHQPDDPTSLSDDVITVILEDRSGVLWVGTHGGLNRFDPQAGTFSRYQHDPDDPRSLSDNQVRALYEDRQGTLWVGTGSPSDPPEGLGGLNRFDPASETFTHYVHDPNDESSLIDSQVRALYEDSRGTFWVGTWGDGLHTMDRARGTFTRYPYDPERRGQLSRPHLRDESGNDGVSFVHEDASGVLWIGAVNGGLNRYDPLTGLLTHYEHDPDDLSSLSDNRVWTIYESREGTLWIGALGGLHKLDPAGSQFPHYTLGPATADNSVRALFEGQDGVLWLGTSHGLYKLDRDTGTLTRYDSKSSLIDGRVLALYEDREGLLWVSTWGGGLDRYDPLTGALTHFENDPDDPNSLSSNIIRALYEDQQGTLWIGTELAGLNRFERETRTFTRYLHDPDDPNSLSQNSVQALFEDQAGVLWIGTGGGLNRFDRETETFTRYAYDAANPGSLSDNVILSIYEDRAERLWIGTESGGLNQFDRKTGTFTRFNANNSGLPDNQILGILGDDHGNLWMSTSRGLTRFNPEKNTFHTYGADQGLSAEPFYAGSYHMSRRGELFFGGRNGFHAFFPEQIRIEANPHLPQVALTDFRLFNQSVRPGPERPLQKAISETQEITLSHRQNDVSFSFAALHYSHPARNQYAYMLEPHEDAWNKVGFERRATYTSLDPGEYVFRVKAANSDGVWNEEEVSVRLIIEPPFWATWWFRVLALTVLMGLVFGSYRLRVRQIQAQNRLLEREVADRTRDLNLSLQLLTETQDQLIHSEKMASLGKLATGIAHEMRNPLNFVTNFSALSLELFRELRAGLKARNDQPVREVLDEVADLLDDLEQNAVRINEHGRRAEGIVRSMVQHAQVTPGQRQATDLNALLDEYVTLAYYGLGAHYPDFTVTLERHYDEAMGRVEVIPQEMGRVFLNLLNNAFYAVRQQALSRNGSYTPRVSVHTHHRGETVEIRVQDNGTGIPEAIRDTIFEPFFTTKPTGTGAGLGLSLSYDIVIEGHGGALAVESTEGEGATFVITLPSDSRT